MSENNDKLPTILTDTLKNKHVQSIGVCTAAGAAIGTVVPVIGTGIGAGVGAIIGGVNSIRMALAEKKKRKSKK